MTSTTTYVNQVRVRDHRGRIVEGWHDRCSGHTSIDDAIICGDTAKQEALRGASRFHQHFQRFIDQVMPGARLAMMDCRMLKRVITDEEIEAHLDILAQASKPKRAEP